MKKLGIVLSCIIVVMLSIVPSSNSQIKKILGAVAQCDTASSGCFSIPLIPTTLCTVSCAKNISPSLINSSRFWGTTGGVGNCRISTNGGASWSVCASQAFAAGNQEFFAEAADGTVVAIGDPGAVCTIRTSTNNGISWTTVFTQAGSCVTSGLEGQRVYCLSDGKCQFLGVNGGNVQIFRSPSSGTGWSAGETGVGNSGAAGGVLDGTTGILVAENPGVGGGGISRTFVTSTDNWVQSVTWNGTQGDCWGSVIYNTVPGLICQGSTATPDGRYTLRDNAGTVIKSLNLPDALITSIDSGGVAISPFPNVMYIMAQATTGTAMSTYVSRDGLATFNRLTSFSGGGAGVRGGNAFYANGCIYFSVGSTPMFGKIC